MIARFGAQDVDPVIAATKRRLQISETVLTYYNDKRRLLDQSRLDNATKVNILTDGMPEIYRFSIIAAEPPNPATWLRVALALEAAKPPKRTDRNRDHAMTAAEGDSREERRKPL